MKRLVLYSDQVIKENAKVDARLLSLLDQPNPKIGYIPSCGDKDRKFFDEKCFYYRKLGFDNFLFFDLDDEFDPSKIDELLSCNVIHLSAGDPIYFINNIKTRNFLDKLTNFVNQGGVLIGVSGGSLQMTKTIALFKTFNENLEKVTKTDYTNLSALNLVDFEFLPHYNRWNEGFVNTVKEYSAKFNTIIYACEDGDGIVIIGDKVEFIGEIVKIEKGSISPVSNTSQG